MSTPRQKLEVLLHSYGLIANMDDTERRKMLTQATKLFEPPPSPPKPPMVVGELVGLLLQFDQTRPIFRHNYEDEEHWLSEPELEESDQVYGHGDGDYAEVYSNEPIPPNSRQIRSVIIS